tara:strand:+ start:911 stop:2137 length:1227 start_codon:yes stop_codon:yes gene_type:complete
MLPSNASAEAQTSEQIAALEARVRTLEIENATLRASDNGHHNHQVECSSELLDVVLAQLTAGVLVVNQAGECLVHNRIAAELTGIELAGTAMSEWPSTIRVFELDGITQVPSAQLPWTRALAGEVVTDWHVVMDAAHLDSPRTLALSSQPLRDGDTIWAAAVIVDDITERIQARRELKRSTFELQSFAHVVSHDLHEPLRKVTSFTSLLQEDYGDQLNAEANEYIDFMVEGATRLRRLLLELLDYSRLTTNRHQMQPVDMHLLTQEIVTQMRATIVAADATIAFDDLPIVLGDKEQLRCLIEHLLANALQFRGPDAPRILIAATNGAAAWQFSVRDNGIGIAPKYQERIFSPFQRLHARDAHPGTGIGLAVCARIVSGHGDELTVQSELGQGATFRFDLPHTQRQTAP